MNRKEKRKRISENNAEVIIDVDAWLENCTSKKVRHHTTFAENFQIEFWYDKHYWDRLHLGDDDGDRVGIEFEYVEPLVIKSFKHLMYYSLKHRDLLFVNHPPPRTRNIRIVLRQTYTDKITLNIAVEYHFVSLNKFEVTIVTAMSIEDFQLGDNQYAIEFNEEESILYRLVNKQVVKVDDYEE
jgi:hypothetical protein